LDHHDLAQEFDQPGAQQLLTSAPLARLAYTGPDGHPRAIPIGFLWNGNQIVICTATTSPKVRAMTSRPSVALTIDVGSTPAEAKALLIRGVARIDIIDGVPEEYIAGSAKALDAEQAAEFEQHVRGMYDQMARIRIEPQWARFYDFGSGRLPSFLKELAEKTK
jgi:Pyridoxamine 5'-phosphate oxidase